MIKYVEFVLIGLLLTISSCNNTIDLNAEFKEIPIIYGILDPADSIQLIKINKAFQNQETSALSAAQVPDSLYFKENLIVTIEEYNGFSLIQSILLNSVISPKYEGVFAGPNQTLYATPTSFKVNPQRQYRLVVQNAQSNEILARAITEVPNEFEINISTGNEILIDPRGVQQFPFNWTVTQDAAIYEVDLILSFKEVNSRTGETVNVDLSIPLIQNIRPIPNENKLRYVSNGSNIFIYLALALDKNEEVCRYLDTTASIRITAGAPDLETIIRVQKNRNFLAQISPTFSNIDGGIGIFSSKFTINFNRKLTTSTLNNLMNSDFTKELNFKLKE